MIEIYTHLELKFKIDQDSENGENTLIVTTILWSTLWKKTENFIIGPFPGLISDQHVGARMSELGEEVLDIMDMRLNYF